MRRVLFRVLGIPFYAYPTLLYVGLVSGVLIGRQLAASAGLDASTVTLVAVALVAPALLGARLLFVAVHWRRYRHQPSRILHGPEGGAALYGGLLLAMACSLPLLIAMGIPVGAFWDIAAVIILVGMIPTRIGCLLNGCCGGRPSDHVLAVHLPDARGLWTRRMPTQALEALAAAVILAVVAACWARERPEGAIFLMAAGSYGAVRLVLEPLREIVDRLGAFSVYRTISAGVVAGSLLGLLALYS